MVIVITTWSPDTCQCVFDYSWDTTTDATTRVHTLVANVFTCTNHAVLPLTMPDHERRLAITGGDPIKALEMLKDTTKNTYRSIVEVAKKRRLASFLDALERTDRQRQGMLGAPSDEELKNTFVARLAEKNDSDHLRAAPELFPLHMLQRPETQQHAAATDRDLSSFLEQRFAILDRTPLTALNLNVFNTVIEENQRKNQALDVALNTLTTQLATTDPGSGARILKPTIDFAYTWTGSAPSRVLNMRFNGVTLNTSNKSSLLSAENTKFGTGKVLVP